MKRAILSVAPGVIEVALPLPKTTRIVGVMWDPSVAEGLVQFIVEDPTLLEVESGMRLPHVDCICTRSADGSVEAVLA